MTTGSSLSGKNRLKQGSTPWLSSFNQYKLKGLLPMRDKIKLAMNVVGKELDMMYRTKEDQDLVFAAIEVLITNDGYMD